MAAAATSSQPVAGNLAASAIAARQNQTPDAAAIATKIIADNGGARRPNLSEIKRNLDAIKIQDAALGSAVRAEIERQLTPVQRGQLAAATYVQGGVVISDNAKTPQQQFSAPVGSADRSNYARLDKMFGDGNPRTNDSAVITRKINDLIASGLPLDKFLAQEKAVEAGWTAKVGNFLAQFSPSGLLAGAAQPAIAYLTRQAGLGDTEWGGHLQRVLDTPGSARAFNAGLNEGLLNGAKDMVVGIASAAGRMVQYGADNSLLGQAGDFARSAVPDGIKDWLRANGAAGVMNEALPSARRGEASATALGDMAAKVGDYFSSRTPGQVADDVKNAISAQWDSLKADHARAAAQSPEAEARWWGQVTGRITFEVAATFIPVAGVAGKAAKGARVADGAADVLRAGDKIGDAVRAGDVVADGARTAGTLSQTVTIGQKIYRRYTGTGPLFRGDSRAPADIFAQGFKPKGTATDLAAYVQTNTPSVYVSTSTSIDVARSPVFSGPGSFVYEIDAAAIKGAGIDVNASLGKHALSHELEVAVPGGVPIGAIKSARQIQPDGSLGPKIPNPNFGN